MKLGDTVTYHSFSAGPCRAKVMGIRADGTIDVDVDTGARDPLRLTKLSIAQGRKAQPGECSIKGDTDGEEIKASA